MRPNFECFQIQESIFKIECCRVLVEHVGLRVGATLYVSQHFADEVIADSLISAGFVKILLY